MTTTEIKLIRHATGLNTSEFGALLGVSGRTVEAWEGKGRYKPNPSARRMLEKLQEEQRNAGNYKG